MHNAIIVSCVQVAGEPKDGFARKVLMRKVLILKIGLRVVLAVGRRRTAKRTKLRITWLGWVKLGYV